MKKIVLSTAMLLALYSCKNSTPAAGDAGGTTTAAAAKTEQPQGDGSIVGKWRAVDMHYEAAPDPKTPLPPQEQISASIQRDSMIFEFLADGVCKNSMRGMDPKNAKYKKNGNKIEVTDEKGKNEAIEIVKLSDKEMILKMGEEKMTMTFNKM